MTNEEIVKRLREYAVVSRLTRQDELCRKAADAIEQLVSDLDKALMDHRSTIEDIEAERDDPDSVG